jgi:hypothetical protein
VIRLLKFFVIVLSLALPLAAEEVSLIPLTAPAIEGEGPMEDRYYTFVADAGAVTAMATMEFVPGTREATLELDFLDETARVLSGARFDGTPKREEFDGRLKAALLELAEEVAEIKPVTKRKRARVTLEAPAQLFLRVKVGAGIRRFEIKLDGPLDFPDSAAPEEPEAESEMEEGAAEPPVNTEAEVAPATPERKNGTLLLPHKKRTTLMIPTKTPAGKKQQSAGPAPMKREER